MTNLIDHYTPVSKTYNLVWYCILITKFWYNMQENQSDLNHEQDLSVINPTNINRIGTY